jgi:hypothetical protein
MNEPLFVPNVFSKVLAWTLIITGAGLVGIILLFGHISTLDLYGTLVSAVIIAYIIHLIICYG